MDPTNSGETCKSYELMPVCSDSLNDDDEGILPPSDVQHLEQRATSRDITNPTEYEGEESTEHTSSAQVSATDTHALPPANDGEGHSTLFCIKLPETLADSCLHCIAHVQSIEMQLNERGYDNFNLFVDVLYAKDIEAQLREGGQQFLISVIGLHNAGKSTLINAILGDELLPQRNKNETGVRVYIQDCPDYHRGPCMDSSGKCLKCPKLVPFHNGTFGDEGCQGKEEINVLLHTLNQRSRVNPKEDICPYLLLANVPILRSAGSVMQGQQVYLVDTPGLGDSKRSIAKLAEKSVVTSPAYVYVMSYNNLEDEKDSNAFQRMYEKDEELLESKRLTIAVTQYDSFFENSNDENYGDEISNFSDEVESHDVKSRICHQLQDALGLTSPLPHDLINLASGMWALKARKLTPTEENLAALRKCWETYLKKASVGEIAASHDVAERLLAASGIGVLEKRIEVIAYNIYASWIKNLRANCLSYSRHATSEIQKAIQKHSDAYEVWKSHSDALDAVHGNVIAIWDGLCRSISKTSSQVYHHLKGSCREDFNPLQVNVMEDARSLVTDHCTTLQEKCIQRVARKYTPDDFKSDLEGFLTDLSSKLTDMFGEMTLEKVFLRQDAEFNEMEEQFERMMSNARLICQSSEQSISLYNTAITVNQGQSPRLESRSADTNHSITLSMKTLCLQSTLMLPNLMREIMLRPFEASLQNWIGWILRALLYGGVLRRPSQQLWQEWQSYSHSVRFCHVSEEEDASGLSTDGEMDMSFSLETSISATDSASDMPTLLPEALSSPVPDSEMVTPTSSPQKLSSQPPTDSEVDMLTPPHKKLSKQQVIDAIKQLKELVNSELQKYAEKLIKEVASDFYGSYHVECKKRLDIFERTIRQDFDAAWKHHQMEKEKKAKLLLYIDELKQHLQQLQQIHDHICKKADEALSHASSLQ